MKTVLIFAGFVALVAGTFPYAHYEVKTKKLDDHLVEYQRKVLSLVDNVGQLNTHAEYYKIGKEYDVEANIDNYTKKDVVHTFLGMYRVGFMPKTATFSIFHERQREEAEILFELFYYAKDFETFYKTAAFARVYLNEEQFLYAFYIAVLQRTDLNGIVLPAPYELWPQYFVNIDVLNKLYRAQMQNGIINEELAAKFGITKKENAYYFYYNYSNPMAYDGNEEYKLAYFTEDIGLNSYYYYFHNQLPFWLKGEEFLGTFKERRGEIYFYFYQQLLARYYLERLSNGLGEIPTFSWFSNLKTGYYPFLVSTHYPFVQRSNDYYLPHSENIEYIQFLDTYEKSFLQFLQRGQFKAYKKEVDFYNSKSINFVGNYWQTNPDLYDKPDSRNYERSYEIIARRVLGAAPKPYDMYNFMPTALDFYQTSLRDPAFYQLYAKIMEYIMQYKEWLEPYDQDTLHYVGVKVNDIKVDKLTTFFEYYDFNATSCLYLTAEEQVVGSPSFIVRQPRLNHKPFTVTVDVKSDVEAEAVFKIFMAPKYDSEGRVITLEDNWMNFVELDSFKHKITPGQNKVERKSEDFFYYKEDSVPVSKIYKYLNEGKVPEAMSEDYDSLPLRLMLPRGTKGGFPVQFFVFVYPYQSLSKEWESMSSYILDNKPFGYPFDRPVRISQIFMQPNMYFKDVYIYQEGVEYPWYYEQPAIYNEVPKH